MKRNIILFGTSTPRSGSALVSNIISAHKDVLITKDLIHFFRHIYSKYSPISNKANQYKLVHEMCLRIRIRNKINFSPRKLLKKFENVNTYAEVIKILSDYILSKNKKKTITGESANGEWRNIETFLNLSENHKSYQVIRDPRAILVSWKKLTYSKGYKYLNILFNWIDSINYSEKYLKKFKKSQYLRLKFEDIHLNPKKNIKKLCNFLELKQDRNMMNQKIWPKLLNTKFNYINVSSYNNKAMFGFSKQRTINWKKHITDWELALIQYLFKKQLKKLNYKILKDNKKLIKKGIQILNSDKLLRKNFKNYLNKGVGVDKRLNDPTKPENWAAVDTSKNISAKFIDTKDYKIYKKELKKIKISSIKFKKNENKKNPR